jgi:hypothetical protein
MNGIIHIHLIDIHFILKFYSSTDLYNILKYSTTFLVLYSNGFQTSYTYGTLSLNICEKISSVQSLVIILKVIWPFPEEECAFLISVLFVIFNFSRHISGHKIMLKELSMYMCKELKGLLALRCLDANK